MNFAYIDNQPFEINEGETILSFVRRHMGLNLIPTLCDRPNLAPAGSCRICSVDIAMAEHGKVKTVAACHTPAAKGQYIYPNSDSVKKLRRLLLNKIVSGF